MNRDILDKLAQDGGPCLNGMLGRFRNWLRVIWPFLSSDCFKQDSSDNPRQELWSFDLQFLRKAPWWQEIEAEFRFSPQVPRSR